MASWKAAMLETGIDRLLNLVSERGKISAKDASKQLSVSVEVIESWAEILEKENLMSKEYTPAGELILSNTAKNTEEKRKKMDDLKEDISFDLEEIDKSIIEKEKSIQEEHKKVEDYEKILLREAGESDKVGAQLRTLSIEAEKLKSAFKQIAEQERKISKDTRSVKAILSGRIAVVKRLEVQLKKFEEEKNSILSDIKVLEKISASLKNTPVNEIYDKVADVQKKAKRLKESHRTLGDRYSLIMRLLGKVR